MPSPALLVAVPLTVAALLAGLRKLTPRWLADLLSILTAVANLVLATLWTAHALHTTQVYWFGNWFPRGHMAIGISFIMDGVGCGLAMLAAFLTTLALLFSWKHTHSGGGHYHPLMLVFLAAMSGFALTGDIFNLFVFFELMSTAAFALCGLKTDEPGALAGAFNFAVTNTIAAFMVLTGIALLYSATGTLNLAQMGLLLTGRHDRLVIAAFAFLDERISREGSSRALSLLAARRARGGSHFRLRALFRHHGAARAVRRHALVCHSLSGLLCRHASPPGFSLSPAQSPPFSAASCALPNTTSSACWPSRPSATQAL